MNARASWRAFAVVQLGYGVLVFVLGVFRDRAFAALDAPGEGRLEIAERFATLQQLWTIGAVAFVLATLVTLGLALAATWKRPGRTFGLAAIVALVVYVAFFAHELLHEIKGAPTIGDRLTWLAGDLSLTLAVVLPVVAAARAAVRRGLSWIGVVSGFALVDGGLSVFCVFSDASARTLGDVITASSVVVQGVVAIAAWRLADAADEAREGSAPTPANAPYDGSAMRLLGWAFLARLLVAMLAQGGMLAAVVSNDFAAAGHAMLFGLVGSIGAGILVVLALIRYLSMPTATRSTGALAFALVAAAIGALLDVGASTLGMRFFDALDAAMKSTSMSAMPNLGDIDDLQATLTWAGRGGTLLGIAATLALVASLVKTARAIEARALEEHAHGVILLVVLVGVGAILASVAVTSGASMALLVLAPILLFTALALLVRMLQLFFRLGAALDDGRGARTTDTTVASA